MTANVLGALREAAEVVLDRLHPDAGQSVRSALELDGTSIGSPLLRWAVPDEASRSTHANDNNASEDGACAVAIVAVFRAFGYRVVRRAVHRSGADYLMLRIGCSEEAFVRLEVSGILGGASVSSRLREKVEELQRGQDRRPGFAAVIAFRHTVRLVFREVPEGSHE